MSTATPIHSLPLTPPEPHPTYPLPTQYYIGSKKCYSLSGHHGQLVYPSARHKNIFGDIFYVDIQEWLFLEERSSSSLLESFTSYYIVTQWHFLSFICCPRYLTTVRWSYGSKIDHEWLVTWLKLLLRHKQSPPGEYVKLSKSL